MKKLVTSVVAAVALSATSAFAADVMPVKAAKVAAPAPAPSPFDVAFGGSIMSDYNFRGISQSDRGPSVFGYFEPRFNISPNYQLYAGIAGTSVKPRMQLSARYTAYAHAGGDDEPGARRR